jgi:hypothetical protein
MIIIKKQFGAMVLGGANAPQKAKVWSGVLNIIVTPPNSPNDESDIDALEEFRVRFIEVNKSLLDVMGACMIVEADRFQSNDNTDTHLDHRTIVMPTLDIDGDKFEEELEKFIPQLFDTPQAEYHDVNISLSIKSV